MCHLTAHKKLRRCFSLLLLTIFSTHGLATNASLETSAASLGKLIVTQFVTAPFPHPARAEGHKYHDQLYSAAEHYADSTVAVFVPKGFHATESLDFVVHFHGWNNTIAGTLTQFQLVEQFSASGKNAILVVPEGPRNAPDSFGGKLEDPDGFKKFMAEVVATLRAENICGGTNLSVGKIILSGHSGRYHVMAAIVDHGGMSANIKEVWLFDALYGGVENFIAWQKKENVRLIDIYTDHGGTKDESEKLTALCRTNAVGFLSLEEMNSAPNDWSPGKIIFLHSDLTHSEVIFRREEFLQFLKTSGLEDK